jgi:hypothetical protein
MPLVTYLEERANRVWLGIGGLAVAVVSVLALINAGLPVFPLLYSPLPGLAFIAAGLGLWGRHRIATFLVLVGFSWFIHMLEGLHVPVVVALSVWFAELWRVVLAHTALAYPGGELRPGLPRALVLTGYAFVLAAGLVRTMAFRPYDYFNCECPRNALGFINNEGFFNVMDRTYGIIGGVFELVLIALLVRLYFQARGAERSLHAPLLATAGAFALILIVDLVTQFAHVPNVAYDWMYFLVHLAFIGATASYVLALRRERVAVESTAAGAATS